MEAANYDKGRLKEYLEYKSWQPEPGLRVVVGLDYFYKSAFENMEWSSDSAPLAKAQLNDAHFRLDKLGQLASRWYGLFDNDADRVKERPPKYFIDFALSKGIRPEWMDWAIEQGLYESDTPAKVEADTSPSGEDWKTKARAITDSEALKRYARGEREITARNICGAVATELARDLTTHGTRGERAPDSIRNEALKGWKFIPPTGTNGTSGTKK